MDPAGQMPCDYDEPQGICPNRKAFVLLEKTAPTYTENRRKLVGITDPNWNQQKSQKLSFVLSGFTELKKCGPEIVDKL